MRVHNFVLATGNTSQAGINETFTTGSVDSSMTPFDVVVAVATPRGEDDSDPNPVGNVNIFVSSRTTGGSTSITFEKSAPTNPSNTGGTTDSIDSIIFSAG